MNNSAIYFYNYNEKCLHPVWEWIFVALLSFSASSLAIKINQAFLGRNLVEPYILVGFLGLWGINKEFRKSLFFVFRSAGFWILFTLISFFAVLGILTSDFTTSDISGILYAYSDYRSLMILVLFFFLSRSNFFSVASFDRVALKFFLLVSVFEIFSVVLLNNISMDSAYYETSRQSAIALAPMFLTARFLVSGNIAIVLVSVVISGLITVISLMRFNYVYLFLEGMLILSFLFVYMKSVAKMSKVFILIASIIGLVLISIPIVINYFESNPVRLIHGLYRLESLFGIEHFSNNYDGSESVRIATTKVIFLEIGNLILPKGLGAISHIRDVMSSFRGEYGIMSTVDSGLFYLVYHFGWMLGMVSILYIFGICIKQELRLIRFPSKVMFLMDTAFIFAFLGLLVLKAWPFIYLSVAFQYAMLIPYVLKADEFAAFYDIKYKN